MSEENKDGEKLVTLAIHTYQYATSLKRILESHNIESFLEKLVLSNSDIVAGVRIRIKETDIPHALKITESMERPDNFTFGKVFSSSASTLLLPVDFSPRTYNACKIGFEIADRLSLTPVFIYAYATPFLNTPLTFDPTQVTDEAENLDIEISEMKMGRDLYQQGLIKMNELRNNIEKKQQTGELPKIPFKTEVSEGVAEDVIKEYCRENNPEMIVMATRCKAKRNEELIGSVTAEVMDSCRVPVFSIPENEELARLKDLKKIVYLCNLDQQDIITIDTLMRLFEYPEVDITLLPLGDKMTTTISEKTKALCDYFNKAYPDSHFKSQFFPLKNFMEDFKNYESQAEIDMILISNKRRNFFSRLLNPGVAHKLIFERDLPMLAFPV